MSDIKILFSDIDGTLINEARVLSEATIAEFNRIKATVPVILISARMPKAMVHLQKMAEITHFPIIAYNGGLILIDEKEAFSLEISTDIIQHLIDFNSEQKIHFSLYNNDDWYVPKMDYWAKREQNNTKVIPTVLTNEAVVTSWKKQGVGAHKIMCMGNVDDIDELSTYLKTNFGEQLHIYRSKSTYIEIAPSSISKKTAINFVLQKLYPSLTINDAVAFGDNYNDIEMLEAVGKGVAVANAREEVKAVANYKTDKGTEDGVANFIKKYI